MRRLPTPPLRTTTAAWSVLLAACGADRAPLAPAPTPITPAAPAAPAVPAPPPPPTDTVRTTMVVPGVRHTYRWEVAGPWAIHVLELDAGTCGVSLRTVKALDRVVGRERTTALVARVAARETRPVYGAINADYFSFTPSGVPVGGQVANGEVVRGATNRPVFGVTTAGVPFFGADQLTGTLRSRRGATFAMRRVNEAPDTLNVALYNRFAGDSTPADPTAVEVVVRYVGRVPGVGDTDRATVLRIDTLASGVAVPDEGAVLIGRGRGAAFLRSNVAAGDTITWSMRFPGAPGSIAELVAGDPQLLRAGVSLAPFAGSVAAERNPRTAVGVTATRSLLLVTVDGRQPAYSAGMTLPELTALFQRLGATDALNLDGGGSTTMVLGAGFVNRPSDATGERPVANAITVLGPAPGTCPR